MINQKSIVLVPFPYSNQRGEKVRPSLILSNPKFNKNDDVIICAITSMIKKRPYSIIIGRKDTKRKKLLDVSQIRVDTITRVKKDLIIKKIDDVEDLVFKRVLENLKSIF